MKIRALLAIIMTSTLILSGCGEQTENQDSSGTTIEITDKIVEDDTIEVLPETEDEPERPVTPTTITEPEPEPEPQIETVEPTPEPVDILPDPEPIEDPEPIPTSIFSATPIAFENIDAVVALGNLNPPGHTFPTDHIYFYIVRQPGAAAANEVDLFSPGDLTVTRVSAIQQLNAGITDYTIEMQKGDHLHIRLGHVTSIAENVFGDTTSFQSWEQTTEYSTGGETYRWWSKKFDLELTAGMLIGTAGGNPNQWALDLFLYDMRVEQQAVANPERWKQSWYLNAVDPLAYYEEGMILDRLLELLDRTVNEGELPPFGSALQDVPGTAQGCWFREGITETYPEDPHLALIYHNIEPDRCVVSVGTGVLNLPSDAYLFSPEETGTLNRAFSDIKPDGAIYGFRVEGFSGTIIVSMPDTETLWVQALPGVNTDLSRWVFTEGKTIFKR